MATRRAPTKTWVAREGNVYIARYPLTIFTSGNTLSGVFAGSASGIVFSNTKNITVTPPETGYDKQDFIGKDSSNFQNQLLDEKPVGIATATMTLILGEDETIEDYIMSGTSSAPSGYTRYQIGNNQTSINTLTICVTNESNTSSDYNAFGLQNAKVTKWGDVRISGPDAHWEQDLTVICLAKDFYYEFKD